MRQRGTTPRGSGLRNEGGNVHVAAPAPGPTRTSAGAGRFVLLPLVACAVIVVSSALASGPSPEPVYYLGNLAQSAFPTPSADATYGPVNIACRTGWRFIQPGPPPATPDWTTVDACHTAAAWLSRKWSLSIKIGADTPLWLYSSTTSCPAATATAGEATPGYGALTGFPFIWKQASMGTEYPDESAQCVPIPWMTNYQTALKSFIGAVAHHVAAYNDALLDHVVVTGVNAQTAENIQPHCATSGCGYPSGGGVTDLNNWATIVGGSCLPTPGGCPAYYSSDLAPAYDTIVGYWATAFKPPLFSTPVPLAAMFSDGPNFPFDASGSNATGLELLNQFVTDVGGGRAIVMNNAAQVVTTPGHPPSPALDTPILCYQGEGTPCLTPTPTATASIAFQEWQGVTLGQTSKCSNLSLLLSDAAAENSLYMEVYQLDINTCF